MKTLGDVFIQVRISRAKNDPHRSPERSQFRNHFGARAESGPQVFIQAKESWLSTGPGLELLIEQWDIFISDVRIPEEVAHLPPIHAPKEPVVMELRDEPGHMPDPGCREEPDRFWRSERGHVTIISIQQDQPGHALRLGQSPVNRWRTRGIMSYQDHLAELQLADHGLQLEHLIRGGVGITGWLIGRAPAQKIKGHDAIAGRE